MKQSPLDAYLTTDPREEGIGSDEVVSKVRKIESSIIDLWSAKYQAKEHLEGERCTVCGKKTSRQNKGLGVIVSDGGGSIIHPEDNEKEIKEYTAGYMGWWAVGSECIKKVPKEFQTRLGK